MRVAAAEHLSGRASPTERTMAWLRQQGYTVDKVEHRVAFGRTTRDLFGFADIVALKPGHCGVLAVQATTGPHLAERVAKVVGEPRAGLWRSCSNMIIVVGWAMSAWGETRHRWEPIIMLITDHGPVNIAAL